MKSPEVERKIRHLGGLICNTPLVEISLKYKGMPRMIYAKAEHMNMTGSIKDRMALHILHRAVERGALHPGDVIVEATSGNTGIAFSAIGSAIGHRVVIFMPDWMSEERKNLIRGMGAEVRLVSKQAGGFLGAIRMAEEYAATNTATFLPRQFSNDDNVDAHYHTTGPEIWWQLAVNGIRPAAFVAGVGTGGTVMGVGKFLKEKMPEIKVHPLEPANSPTLSTGCKVGSHRIQGISDEFIPPIVRIGELDPVISVDDGDAIIMAQKLAGQIGLGVGISSGANFIGALIAQNHLGGDAVVVTIFPDDNKKYLSTDLLRVEPPKTGFYSTDIELIEFRAIKRTCHTCCDPNECRPVGAFFEEAVPTCPLLVHPRGAE